MTTQTRPMEITIRGGSYDHVHDLGGDFDGGISIRYQPQSLQEVFPGMLERRAYEVCEFSLANYLILRASGEHWLTALPIFLNRAFRHAVVLVRRDSPLEDLRALTGKRVGVPDYSMTAAVWLRGLLRAEYGVDHRSITWMSPRKQRLPIPAGTRIELTDDDLESALLSGQIDALLGFSPRDAQLPAQDRKLRALLREPERAERDYFARTGIYPINHCVVIRNDVLQRSSQLPFAIATAYVQAKRRAYARGALSVLPWGGAHRDDDMRLFGGDPLAYGMNAVNRMVVGALADDLREQGFIDRAPDLDAVILPVSDVQDW